MQKLFQERTMGDNSKEIILEIWEYFVELLPEHEYLQLKKFVEGKFSNLLICILQLFCLGLDHENIERYILDLCKLNLKVLTDFEVADKIVAMTKTKYGVQIERSGKLSKKKLVILI